MRSALRSAVSGTAALAWLCMALAPGCNESPTGADAASPAEAGPPTPVSDAAPPVLDADASAADGSSEAGPLDASASDGGSLCDLPQVVGPCEAAMPRFWFNAASGRCQAFVYGGCGGNANNFASVAACAAACAPAVTNPCTITDCDRGRQCVFQANVPRCAAACDDAGACGAPEVCSCGATCAGCRDCVRVCF